jgi:hypothetical protein
VKSRQGSTDRTNVGRQELVWHATSKPREKAHKISLVFQDRFTTSPANGGHHLKTLALKVCQKLVLLLNALLRPAKWPIKFDDKSLLIADPQVALTGFDSQIKDPIFVGIELLNLAGAAEAKAFDGVEDEVGLQAIKSSRERLVVHRPRRSAKEVARAR